MSTALEFVLTLACRDTKGIVHAVSGLLYQAGCNIIDSQQFGDLEGEHASGYFFMRVHFQAPPQLASVSTLPTAWGGALRAVSAESCGESPATVIPQSTSQP